MTVIDYIKNALFDHDCVIVAGFGGFLVETKSAETNPISDTWIAPSTNLAFNPSLTKDDGLLKSEISIGENITLDTANDWIKSFVESIEFELKKNKSIDLEGLGIFTQLESKIIFTPEKKSNFNIEGFGLSSFVFEPLNNLEEDMKQVRPVSPARRVVKREPVKKGDSGENSGNENASEAKSSSGLKAVLIVLPILLVLGLGGFFGYKYTSTHKSNSHVVENKVDSSKHTTDEASLLTTKSNTEEVKIEEEATFDESKPVAEVAKVKAAPIASKVSSANKNYHIIGGVFTSEKNADKYVSKHPKGEVLQIDNLYKVSVASYSSLNEALQAIPNLQAEFGSDIWVTKR